VHLIRLPCGSFSALNSCTFGHSKPKDIQRSGQVG